MNKNKLQEKIDVFQKEANSLITDIRNQKWYEDDNGETNKKIKSLKRRSLYLYKKVTNDKKRKFRDIQGVIDALTKFSSSMSSTVKGDKNEFN